MRRRLLRSWPAVSLELYLDRPDRHQNRQCNGDALDRYRAPLIIIYGIGFGPVTPPTPAGAIPSGSTTLVNKPHFRFGETPATLQYYGLSGCCVGLYQFNVVVPNVSPGDMPLNMDVGGVTLSQNLFIRVGP